MWRRIILLFSLLFFFTLAGGYTIQVSTEFLEDKTYQTVVSFISDTNIDVVKDVLSDFKSYDVWALEGLDGKSAGTEDLIGLLSDVKHYPEENTLEIMYDVRLPWPFGSTGNTARFGIENLTNTDDGLSFMLVMIDNSAALKEAILCVDVTPNGMGSSIVAEARIRFSFFLNLFFTLPAYRHTIEWRIVRIITNMERYVDSGGSAG